MGLCRRAQVKHFTVTPASWEVTPGWLLKPKPRLAFITAPQRTQAWTLPDRRSGEESDWDMVGRSVIFQIGDSSALGRTLSLDQRRKWGPVSFAPPFTPTTEQHAARRGTAAFSAGLGHAVNKGHTVNGATLFQGGF